MGWTVANSLETIHSLAALTMALSHLSELNHPQLIHHSDRGIQYCSDAYTQTLKNRAIQISMTQDSKPTDNGIAERLNGILKQEFFDYYTLDNLNQVKDLCQKIVQIYNQQRPHLSCSFCTPEQVHLNNLKVDKT